MKYWVIFPAAYDDGAKLTLVPETGPKGYKYDLGVPLSRNYPKQEDATMLFNSSHPDRIKLYDIVGSVDSVFVVNSKVRGVLNEIGANNLEYLPVRLLGHKREIVSDDYYILNPLGGGDIIDMEKSEYVMGALDESQIRYMEELVIKDNLPEDAKIFRASMMLNQLFISDDVRIAFEEAGITGYKLLEAEGWDGLDI